MSDVLNLISSPEEANPYLKLVIYGFPKTGKTSLAAQAPDCLVIDFDKGATVLAGKPEYAGVKVFKYEGFDSLLQLVLAFREGKLDNIKTVIFDTQTEWLYKMLDEYIRKAAIESRGKRNPYIAYQSDYGEIAQMMRTIIMAFVELPVHLIILAHVREVDDDEGVWLKPSMSPKVYETTSALVDTISYLKRETDGTRTLIIEPTNRIQAGTRIPMPAQIKNPTFKLILEAFERTKRGN